MYNVIGEATNWYLRSVLFALITAKSRVVFTVMVYRIFPGSFTLMEMDLSVNLDSDFKLDGYIVLCRTCPHCTDSDLDPYTLFLYRTGV